MSSTSIASAAELQQHFASTRAVMPQLSASLSAEDLMVQSMPDASPGKWHLAHTTWFFETFVLARSSGYCPHNDTWQVLFNSYYQSVGPMHSRPQRGLLSRPPLSEVLDYRKRVDEAVSEMILAERDDELPALIALGLHHDQQHQELLLTDIKHAFACNPLRPAYAQTPLRSSPKSAVSLRFIDGTAGVVQTGHAINDIDGFAFDNETPRHATLLQPHALANRLITNAEYLAFVHDGGYRDAALWLSDGWATVQAEGWQHPLYWNDELTHEFTLAGMVELDPETPVAHVSYFEADAFARWAGERLPTEAEWENAAAPQRVEGNFQERKRFHPAAASGEQGLLQCYGDLWEWTASPYISYPGFKPLPGSLGEYNGKFMNGQWVLRGGSCVTPADHVRATYRNFFPPHARWQFAGIRLGQDR